LNTKLEANDIPPMSSLVKDLSDGVRLIQLMVRNRSFTNLTLIVFYIDVESSWDIQEIMGIVTIILLPQLKLIMVDK
jgi:hypothetical protein